MIQKKLNSSNRVHSSLLLYVTCIISVLTINLVNMGRGFGMEQRQVEQVDLNNPTGNDIKNKGIAEAVVEELRKIDGSSIFNEQFDDMLEGQKNSVDTAVAASFASKLEPILDNLHTDSRGVTLNIIRRMEDLAKLAETDDYYSRHKIFFKNFNQVFYHSKRLLNVVITPQLADIYLRDLGNLVSNETKTNEKFAKQIEVDRYTINNGKAELRTKQVYGFAYKNKRFLSENYRIFLEMKSAGMHFGGEYQSIKISDNHNTACDSIINYFLKTFHGYPACNNKGSGETITDAIHETLSIDSAGNINDIRKKIDVNMLDLREPFTYKVLEALNLGPETHFLINPYIRNGFYIVTRDLTNIDEDFKLANELDVGSIKNTFLLKLENYEQFSTAPKYFTDLNELALFVSITNISDIKTDNFGFIINKNTDKHIIRAKEIREWKVIDFLNNNITDEYDIESKFMQGMIVYGNTSVSYKVLRREIDLNTISDDVIKLFLEDADFIPKRLNKEFTELQYRLEKFYFGYKALKQFENRLNQYKLTHGELFNDGDLLDSERILEILLQQQSQSIKTLLNTRRNDLSVLNNRTNAELIGFENGDIPSNVTNSKERLKYLTGAFENLDTFCAGIICNYKKLKTYINDGYNQYLYNRYFDENGELTPEVKQRIQLRALGQAIPPSPLLKDLNEIRSESKQPGEDPVSLPSKDSQQTRVQLQ